MSKSDDAPLPCDKCRRMFHPAALDAKPSASDLEKHGSLEACADAGCDFERLECRECSGPGYLPR
jgi:hypothetical protein